MTDQNYEVLKLRHGLAADFGEGRFRMFQQALAIAAEQLTGGLAPLVWETSSRGETVLSAAGRVETKPKAIPVGLEYVLACDAYDLVLNGQVVCRLDDQVTQAIHDAGRAAREQSRRPSYLDF